MGESNSRGSQIVADPKGFSRVEPRQEWQWADVHQGLKSTLNIVNTNLSTRRMW